VDFISDLPYELSIHILRFLAPSELCVCSHVSRSWNHATEDDFLWKKHCEFLWRGKLIYPSPLDGDGHALLSVRADFSKAVSSLTTKEMRSLLQRRKVNTTALVEKAEFLAAITSSTPTLSPRLGLTSKWKASFAAELIDSRRLFITWEEVTRRPWRVTFLNRQFIEQHQPPPDIVGHFGENYIWMSPLGDHSWHFSGEGTSVQIGQFPTHHTQRDKKTWDWAMRNEFVRLEPVNCS